MIKNWNNLIRNINISICYFFLILLIFSPAFFCLFHFISFLFISFIFILFLSISFLLRVLPSLSLFYLLTIILINIFFLLICFKLSAFTFYYILLLQLRNLTNSIRSVLSRLITTLPARTCLIQNLQIFKINYYILIVDIYK